MPRLQSDVSAGKAGRKGAALNAVGDNPGSASAEIPRKGNSDGTGVMSRGEPNQPAYLDIAPAVGGANAPLAGHNFMDNPATGNSPKRSGGSKTPSADEMVKTGRE